MVFKHLQYTSFQLAAFIDGKVQNIEWQSGGNSPFFANATLVTEDPKLIEYIKKMPEFGQFIVEVEAPKVEKEGGDGGDVEPSVYDEVTTVQQAKDILVQNHEALISKLTNKTAVLAYAASVNVQFPNLPVE